MENQEPNGDRSQKLQSTSPITELSQTQKRLITVSIVSNCSKSILLEVPILANSRIAVKIPKSEMFVQ